MTEVERFTSDPENMRLYQQERVILETSDLISDLLDRTGITKADLAERLGRSKSYVTQLLNGRANMTLRTISDVMWALDSSLVISAAPLSIHSGRTTDFQDLTDGQVISWMTEATLASFSVARVSIPVDIRVGGSMLDLVEKTDFSGYHSLEQVGVGSERWQTGFGSSAPLPAMTG
jgi:antitoxin component HigA of HigAB toxin-antitoxin module